MPEYLSPGVYVVEVAVNARPIEGVSTSTASLVGPEVMARLALLVADWTEHNDSDPGIALVELFAWLTESLIYRSTKTPERTVAFVRQMPERGTVAAARLAAAALALVTDRPQSHSSVLKHVCFFERRHYEDFAEVRGATKKKRKSKKRRKTQPSSLSSRKKLHHEIASQPASPPDVTSNWHSTSRQLRDHCGTDPGDCRQTVSGPQ